MSFDVIIPARFQSTRLPGKPLLDIAGKPMIQHVYERACQSKADTVVIATDDSRIADVAKAFGAEVCMTSAQHTSGTARLVEVVTARQCADDHIIVNVQGDEPLIPPENINQVAELLLKDADVQMSTLQEPIQTADEHFDPHVVKVVTNQAGRALYFSRAPIPWDREAFSKFTHGAGAASLPEGQQSFRHVGLYGYRVSLLKQYHQWDKTDLEQIESLEQLRVLWYGAPIIVGTVKTSPHGGVDTEHDLQRVREIFSQDEQ